MPELKNQRHEKYARHIFKGLNYTDAHEAAGYKRSRFNASSMIGENPEILERVRELQVARGDVASFIEEQEAALRHGEGKENKFDLAWLQLELLANVRLARENGKIKEANEGLRLLGDTFGAFSETFGAGKSGGQKAIANDTPERTKSLSDLTTALGNLDFDGGERAAIEGIARTISPERAVKPDRHSRSAKSVDSADGDQGDN